MNRKQFFILIVLVVVLGGAGWLILKKQGAAWSKAGSSAGQKLLPDLAVNDVQRIEIKQGTNQLTLARRNELWRVVERDDYPANFGEISDFLRKMIDLKIVQRERIGASQFARMELTPPGPGAGTNSGTLVEFKDQNGKTLNSLLLGKKHARKSSQPSPFGDDSGFPTGRYLLVGKEQQTLVLVTDPLSNIEPKPETWLDKEFIKVEQVKQISLTSTNATNSWTLSRESATNDWKLADAKPTELLEQGKASAAANALSAPSINDLVTSNTPPAQTGLDQPTVVALETFDGFRYTLNIGKPAGDESYHLGLNVAATLPKERTPVKDEKPEDKEKLDKEFKERNQKLQDKLKAEKKFENRIFLVSKWSIDPLLKDRGQLMQEKKEEKKEDAQPPSLEGLLNPVK